MEAMPSTHPTPWLLISSALATSAALAAQTQEKSLKRSVVPVRAIEAFANVPLSFEPNQGQTEGEVKFLSRGAGHTLFLTQAKAVLLVARFKGSPLEKNWNTEPRISGTVLGMSFIGASRKPQVLGEEELPGKVNYLVGSNARTWRTNIPTYARVTYRDLYPGIDLTYYGRKGQLEYDFVVRPGADLRRIVVGFSGAEKLEVDAQGDLVLCTGPEVIRQRKPIAYQEANGLRREIPVSYVLKGAHRVAFKVAAHDSSRPLVIDPALFYSTYLGGSMTDGGQAIAVDGAGNAYVTGLTNSPGFPTATGAFHGGIAGGFDAFVTKLNAAGSALVYSTYLGGIGDDFGLGIAVDAAGNASLTGYTNSPDFPTTPAAFQTALRGSINAFVTKLNSSGSVLIYSTYLGGSGDDRGFGLAVDSAGNAYVTGYSTSTDFPTSVVASQKTLAGPADAFVTKLNLAGSAPLVYSTYLGGDGDDRGYAVAVDSAGNAYVTGSSTSTDFPTTPGAFQTTYAGSADGFVTKLNPAGSMPLLYSAYLGGSEQDIAQAIAVNASGDAFVTGRTSGNFPTTTGAFQSAYGGGTYDAFVTRLNPSGSARVYSTYLGGTGDDIGYGIALDASDDAYLTGYTNSPNFPTTAGVFQTTFGGGVRDAFVTKLNPAGSVPLLYSTYLGGGGDDAGQGIAVDALHNAYVTGFTGSTNFPTTPSAFQTTFHGGVYDAFVTKIAEGVQLEQCPADGQGECEQTGGQGTVDDHDDGNQGQGSFSFIVRRPSTTQRISGGLQFVNPANGTDVRSVTLSSLLISGNSATIAGTCTNSGVPCAFVADVTDGGPTGTGDTFTISISGGPTRGGPLRSGKIQVRPR
jgi:hypothetical protein